MSEEIFHENSELVTTEDINSILDKNLEILRRENEELHKLANLTAHDRSFLRVSIENSKLKEKLEIATKALLFYASPMFSGDDYFEWIGDGSQTFPTNKKAIEALKDCEELK